MIIQNRTEKIGDWDLMLLYSPETEKRFMCDGGAFICQVKPLRDIIKFGLIRCNLIVGGGYCSLPRYTELHVSDFIFSILYLSLKECLSL